MGTPTAAYDVEQLIGEHHALLRHYGRAQVRCSEQLREQAEEIARLRAQALRLRGRVVIRDTALAWAREDRDALEKSIPGLPGRLALARRVDALLGRIRELMRERLRWQRRDAPAGLAFAAGAPAMTRPAMGVPGEDLGSLEASLRAADLVICQTGCLSHGAYWRVQDHCRRTGKACVLVAQPDALRIVRIRRGDAEDPEAGSPGAAADSLIHR